MKTHIGNRLDEFRKKSEHEAAAFLLSIAECVLIFMLK